MTASKSPGIRPDHPAATSQSDVAADTHGNREHPPTPEDRRAEPPAPGTRATQFDGNPAPQKDDPGHTLKPRDDTPGILEKKQGPRDDQA
ncbi:hypothetical protein [Bordetella sp. 2513F-2]